MGTPSLFSGIFFGDYLEKGTFEIFTGLLSKDLLAIIFASYSGLYCLYILYP
jgi:hypothetical protein